MPKSGTGYGIDYASGTYSFHDHDRRSLVLYNCAGERNRLPVIDSGAHQVTLGWSEFMGWL